MTYSGNGSQVWNVTLLLPNTYVLLLCPGLPHTVMSFVPVKGTRLREQMEPPVQLGLQVKFASQRWVRCHFRWMLIRMRQGLESFWRTLSFSGLPLYSVQLIPGCSFQRTVFCRENFPNEV